MAARLVFAMLVGAALVAGLAGGLVRAGVALPLTGGVVAAHAFLMICVFMGTVIGIERAVAVKRAAAFAGPLASGLSGAAMLAGYPALAAGLSVAAALAFVAVNLVVVRRQRAAHTRLLLAGAACWAAGSLLHALDRLAGSVVPLWFCFLVFNIAAERLEMTRLMRRQAGAAAALMAALVALAVGALLSGASARAGGLLYGAALMALAGWLALFDIARRTVRAAGLSRYMALCLLGGYAWLFVAGAAWAGTALGLPLRDAALHALALGFVFSMVLGHAPVILPAIARIKLAFGWPFYLPLLLLHGSLALRLAGPLAAGAMGNVLALAVFALTVVVAAAVWRARHATSTSRRHEPLAEH